MVYIPIYVKALDKFHNYNFVNVYTYKREIYRKHNSYILKIYKMIKPYKITLYNNYYLWFL